MIARCFWLMTACLLLSHCNNTVEKEREIGYRGKARINPFLAFERFVQKYHEQDVIIQHSWQELDHTQSMIFFPADLLSSQLSVDQVSDWVHEGGHAVFLFDHTEMHRNDWPGYEESVDLPKALKDFLEEQLDVKIEQAKSEEKYQEVSLDEETFQVNLRSRWKIIDEDHKTHGMRCFECGDGLITLITDARLMRNRTINEEQHIELISNLLQWQREGDIIFMRGVGISFFGLLWQKGWMVLVALAVLIAAWLLRHMPRFGPQERQLREDQIRAYDHHLEMIGDFHWRLDRAAALLQPLRVELQDICHQWQSKHGRLDESLFSVMATRAELPMDRVERAMTELHARDNLIFTRTVADLQHIRKAFA